MQIFFWFYKITNVKFDRVILYTCLSFNYYSYFAILKSVTLKVDTRVDTALLTYKQIS